MTKETLLNKEEIKQVIREAKNPIYKNPQILTLGKKKSDIFRVSLENELVLIYGNARTGFVHINNRHNNVFNEPFWKKKKQAGKHEYILDNPSKFSISTIPFLDYINIADKIYKEENYSLSTNTNQKFTDVYEGIISFKHIEGVPYRLILYKGTKIIHNLYPISDKFTKKKIINYRKGSGSLTRDLGKCVSFIEIPYLNHDNNIIYKIIWKFDQSNKFEEIFIQRNSYVGEPFVTYFIGKRLLVIKEYSPHILTQYEVSDLTHFENIILEIENRRKNN